MAAAPRGGVRAADPVRLEVFHHLFAAVCEEMGARLMRSAFSANIKERRDFSCALFDAEGRMLAQAAHIPIHLGSAPLCVRAAMQACDMRPGDAVILNDPFEGGTHLPDVTLVSPIFCAGDERPRFYCANRAHHADVGGAHPGSMAPTFDVHGEGLRIPPTKLVAGGQVDAALLRLLLANMRVPHEREGDLLAQWAANRLARTRFAELEAEHGADELTRRGAELFDWTAGLARELLRAIPSGEFAFEDELESGGRPDGGRATIRVKLSRRAARTSFDFSASDDQVPGPINTTRAVSVSAVFYVLRLLLPRGVPTNDGLLDPVTIVTRPGSLVDASYPAPVCAGNVETSQRLVDCLLGALAKAFPGRIPAASSGTMSNVTFGGQRPDGSAYTYYETIAGGAGAGALADGAHAVHTHMTNTRNTPIEAFEGEFPVRVLGYTIRRGSGGAGARSGGDGVEKRLSFLAPARVSWVAERQARGPWGLAGGARGAVGEARLKLPGAREIPLAAPVTTELPGGSELCVRTPGGGGHGRAKKRL